MSSVAARVKSIVMEVLGVAEESVQIESEFMDDLGLDSTDFLQVIMELERQFQTEIPESVVEKIKTVGDAIAYLSNNPRSE